MENITERGAHLLGQRLGAAGNGVMSAFLTLFFDWVSPAKIKFAYVVFDHLFRARRTDNSLVVSKSSWQVRLLMFSAWLGMCIAYLVWAPSRRLIMIYHGVTGNGANLLIWSWLTIQNDGPKNEINKLQTVFLDTAFAFLVSSYSLTHRALVWRLAKWAFVRVGIPLLCVGALLYYFRERLPLARPYYRVRLFIFMCIYRAWDAFDYVEAQIVERLPRYLQHKWSSYQQARPERAKLPRYQYKPLNMGEIRLLILKKSPLYPSVIQAEMVHRPIYPPPDYEAVSYRWGSSELTEEILVDGCRFSVTKAAFGLLLARRSVWRERVLWIDALCINQDDSQEKSEQVQLMRDIYHRASRVIAYPAGDWRFRLAGSLIYQLWSLAYQYDTDKMDWSATPNEANQPRWRALADLFSNEYFNRAWVIQEIAVGRQTELYVGGTYIPWMVFAEVMNWCFQPKRKHLLIGSDNVGSIWRTGESFENVAVMTTLRPEAESWTGAIGEFGHMSDLENLLYITFKFRAADPRDKVFGLVGIARNTGDTALTTPDYSLPVEQVFQNTARAIFSLPRDRQTVHILALAGTGYSERPRGMPSWVPNFCEERTCYPYSNVFKEDANFRASGGLSQDLELDNETNSLIIKAIKIDKVLDLSEFGVLDWGLQEREVVDLLKILPIMHGFVHAAIDLCEKHPGLPYAPHRMAHDRLWWALIAGRVIAGEPTRIPADAKFEEVFQHWLVHLDHLAGARDWPHYIELLEEVPEDGMVFIADGTETTYQFSVVDACWGRRLAITASGCLCVVPPRTKVGDSVIIPFGSQTPFLIRERDVQSEGIGYELVGEAWVDGVMQGEMIGNADEEFIRIS
ncbi:HET-domain-containing protein [Xylaria grammica]|nr:HET-domain-containing protein [Xylaria grammica]